LSPAQYPTVYSLLHLDLPISGVPQTCGAFFGFYISLDFVRFWRKNRFPTFSQRAIGLGNRYVCGRKGGALGGKKRFFRRKMLAQTARKAARRLRFLCAKRAISKLNISGQMDVVAQEAGRKMRGQGRQTLDKAFRGKASLPARKRKQRRRRGAAAKPEEGEVGDS
jgi:hypothetical protein